MTEDEVAELKEIITEILRPALDSNPAISWEPLADDIVQRLVETRHFYYLPVKLRTEQ